MHFTFCFHIVEKHSSQKDYATGFGGKFGVQSDRVDKSAVGWDHIEKVEKHESQKDYSKGFGGKFGVQEDRKDKSAVGWDYVEKPKQHESQIDHKVVRSIFLSILCTISMCNVLFRYFVPLFLSLFQIFAFSLVLFLCLLLID